MNESADGATRLTRLRLDSLPLPAVHDKDVKEDRGIVLAIGGSVTVAGAILLAATAALRAGAGKLQVATTRHAATCMAMSLPEALVMGLPITRHGEVESLAGTRLLRKNLQQASAVLVGPGMINSGNAVAFVRRLFEFVPETTPVVLDGAAIRALAFDEGLLDGRDGQVVITPHAGEMASLLEIPVEEVRDNAFEVAVHCATRFQAVVVLKGGETFIAHPSGSTLCYRDGRAGLGTSGSGDVLAGVITGLAARGAPALHAAAWGVWAHGSAGNKLARRIGKIGFLASELLLEIPALVND